MAVDRPRRSLRIAPIHRLIGAIWVAAIPLVAALSRLEPFSSDLSLTWWHLAVGFYAAELFVVHLQFRRDAHTFSMSEIPLVFGLLYAGPLALFIGQVVGSAAALALHRRQSPLKLAFNVGQLPVQSAAAIVVFRSLVSQPLTLDLGTMGGVALATIAALLLGHASVLSAIRATGGTEKIHESARVLAISGFGTLAATSLALLGAVVVATRPDLWWLTLSPAILVFVAYRAYVGQSHDKSRVEALFGVATELLRSPRIDDAAAVATERVTDLVKAEHAVVVLYPATTGSSTYVSRASHGSPASVLAPIHADTGSWIGVLEPGSGAHVVIDPEDLQTLGTLAGPTVEAHTAVAAPLLVEGSIVGFVAGVNRLGEVSGFDHEDLRVLVTLSSQLSTSLENGQLTETLAEVRSLKDELEAMVEARDQLVASVSHELRTPLTGVIGLTSLILETYSEGLDAETEQLLHLVVAQGNELSNIIEDLLAHARSQAGTLTVSPEVFVLGHEIETVMATSGLEISWAGSPEALKVHADPLRVRQILRNLLTNARRYGGDDVGIEVVVTGGVASVAIVDDGQGVDPSAEQSIFEAFVSAHDQTHQPQSVGLGLSVARSIARMMDGDLRYERRDGKTRFVLDLPMEATQGSDSASAA